MAFRHEIGRVSELQEAVEDATVTGLQFFNLVKGLPGFPWQHAFHPSDIRDARPEELLEEVRALPNMKKRALDVLSPDARKVFKALQEQAKLHAYSFSLATDHLSEAAETYAKLRDAGLQYDTVDENGQPDEENVRNNALLEATLTCLRGAKQSLLFAATNMASTGATMRNLLLDAAGMDRGEPEGPVSEETYADLDRALEVRRQDKMVDSFTKAVQLAQRSNNSNSGGYRGRGRGRRRHDRRDDRRGRGRGRL
mmetsp:Transcript_33604/g.94536  ORF Transcript_33604/g.94536 Transcript_33604/m.94536 type:complete len:254 (+) Transcript_33604:117-878(+)|eukprot:CAMPEP_0119118368 /NCGR_PEP_ID=MMETSP1310-20130426/272_1 /TAXON_ID=464262 /ORGANISM="Genus nov. species nov., Strain RCC2339" /LENGTH=253 /DNA_ID=CAMNT_0007107729 /DNA_START=75 /DNA_END=836 /DNA_ORIENTATION=-